MTYGPFSTDCAPELRRLYLAELRALCRVVLGGTAAEAGRVLAAAIDDPENRSRLIAAQQVFEALPARPRRQVLATFAALRREANHAP